MIITEGRVFYPPSTLAQKKKIVTERTSDCVKSPQTEKEKRITK